jgi:hypothetical protein
VTTPPCTDGAVGPNDRYQLIVRPCGCQDVYYDNGARCYEHNHVEYLDHPHPSAGDEAAASGPAAATAGGAPASAPPAPGGAT